ncbi:hypothetical protein [Verminephrobacter eiseniae]|uniref:hypothetical protein n=1 Tax=Verminephrobacter eiseniae TaxID=364317 RepID=UPI002238E665|nr:hypothetical protein [Verminephrobacter eiseniae]
MAIQRITASSVGGLPGNFFPVQIHAAWHGLHALDQGAGIGIGGVGEAAFARQAVQKRPV